ncbi:hypothetical protein SPSYN_00831 [Sporotomaculum syntrophicum]|uniref:O-Antigen ligase n=2 Tax=Sporotomaculum syntrophicum TaxID=182264 RepID=A0A9D2WRM5_9FIRM|nr:hypothetical protein SPSYN_00831 [Sporotomaculum syntrophicum]
MTKEQTKDIMKINTSFNFNLSLDYILTCFMPFLFAMLVIFDFPPNIRRADYSQLGNTVINGLVILFFCITAVYFFKRFQWSIRNVLACLFVAGFFVYQSVHTYSGQFQFSVSTALTALLICEFLLLDTFSKLKVFHYFRKIMVVLLFLGILVYGMRMLLGTGLFEKAYFYSKVLAAHGYYYLHFSHFYILEGGYVSRMCGPFNEPGVVGTFAALLLIADQFNLRKIGNLILLVAGVLSFSLAFFILCAGYVVFCAITEKRKDLLAMIMVGLFLLVYLLPYLRSVNPVVDELAARFEISGKGLAGDNRTNRAYDAFFAVYMQTEERWLGLGTGVNDRFGATLSYKDLIIDYGLVGFACLMLGLLLLPMAGKWGERKCIYFVLLFLISIYQRPNVMTLSYLALLFGGVEYIFARSMEMSDAEASVPLWLSEQPAGLPFSGLKE